MNSTIMNRTEVSVKCVMAILLLLCLAKMPYAYYQFTKWALFIGCTFLAFSYRNLISLLYASIAILFIPFYKFAIKKSEWQKIDVVIAVLLVLTILLDFNKESNS